MSVNAFLMPFASGDTSKPISTPRLSAAPRPQPELHVENEYSRRSPQRLLRHHRRGVHAHHRWRAPALDSGAHGGCACSGRSATRSRTTDSCRLFEQVLQQRYLGTKRFSLEGVPPSFPCSTKFSDAAAQHGAVEMVMGMSHRGRLNVIIHVAKRATEEVFAGFEDVDPRSVLGCGDVKYHIGATGEYTTRSGGKVHIHLVSNPSHLEAVDPVTVGRTRAKQDRAGEGGKERNICRCWCMATPPSPARASLPRP